MNPKKSFKHNDIALFTGWIVYRQKADEYYISYTHYSYLRYICEKYEIVYLVSPLKECMSIYANYYKLDFPNIKIVSLPHYQSYIGAILHVYSIYKAIKQVKNVELMYCRVPDPFSWMPRLLFRTKTILHYVGDPIEVIMNDEKRSFLKKALIILLYYPEYYITILAARKSKVFANGYHITDKLKKYKVKSIPVVSSTINEDELCINKKKVNDILTLSYAGYLRPAKGIDILQRVMLELKKQKIKYIFNIIGDGALYNELHQFIKRHELEKYVILHGHIEDRNHYNKLLCNSDLFIFPSYSEGSPRVILEAMAQGTPVISTPVGVLPKIFRDTYEIRFVKFGESEQFIDIIKDYRINKKIYDIQSNNAKKKVMQHYTQNKFLATIFYET